LKWSKSKIGWKSNFHHTLPTSKISTSDLSHFLRCCLTKKSISYNHPPTHPAVHHPPNYLNLTPQNLSCRGKTDHWTYTAYASLSGDESLNTDQLAEGHTPHSNICLEFVCGKSPCSRHAAIHCTNDTVSVIIRTQTVMRGKWPLCASKWWITGMLFHEWTCSNPTKRCCLMLNFLQHKHKC